MGFPQGSTVVLAHGAWADASIWSKIIFPLRRQSLNVMAVQLPLTTLQDDVAMLQRSLARISGPTVLVGHSYTGAVITEAATGNNLIKALVYVSAMAPDQGESAGGLFNREPAPFQGPKIAPDQYGFIWISEPDFQTGVAPNATQDENVLMATVQKPIALRCFEGKISNPAWKEKPSWFLIASEDRVIHPSTQHFMAERMKAHIHVDALDHTSPVTAPDLVLKVILEAAKETLGS